MEIKNYEKATETLANSICDAQYLISKICNAPFNKTEVEKRQNDIDALRSLVREMKKQTALVEDRLLDLEDYYMGQSTED